MNYTWGYGQEIVKWGFDLDLRPLTLTFLVDITSVIGNNTYKFHDDTMMGTEWKGDRRTDGRPAGRMGRRTDRRTEPFLELLGRS